MADPQHPLDQSAYQVRLEWGTAGLSRLAPTDVVVIVDVLRFCTEVIDAVGSGESYPLDAAAHAVSINGAAVAEAARGTGATVMLGALRNASAVARAVYAEQGRRGRRTSIAVIAAGELTSRRPDASLRFAVEDHLGAGAIIDELASLGVDHSSPEAAAARESFHALRGTSTHLLTASGSGQELARRGLAAEVVAAAEIDASEAVPVLREGAFGPF